MKHIAVSLLVHVGIGQKHLRGAALHNDGQHFGSQEVIARLSGQNHRGVFLSPRLERFQDVELDGGMTKETPSLIAHKDFERGGMLWVANGGVRPVEDIEKKRFKNLPDLVHTLKIKR